MTSSRRIDSAESRFPRRARALSTVLPVLSAAIVVLTASGASADDWGTPGLDAAHERLSSERSGALFSDGRWTATSATGARVLASPVIADGFLVTVDLEGNIRALRADDGQTAWRAAAGSSVQGTPAVAHGRVFVPTLGNALVALRLGDGAPLWTHDLGGMTLSSPTPVDGDVIVAAGFPQRSVVRLSGATGKTVWQSPSILQQFSNTSPAVGGGLVVVGSNGGHYYAFDVATGGLRWEYAADGIVHLAAPLIAGGRVYMAGGNDSNHVHAVEATTGAAVSGWPIDLPTPVPDVAGTRVGGQRAVSSFASVAGLLLLQTRLDDALDTDADGVPDKTLSREIVVALNPASGAVVWQYPLARAERNDPNDVPKFFVCPTPAAFGTEGGSALVAIASSLDPVVVVLDAASGGERARHNVAGPALASPTFANGRLYTAAMNGSIEGLLSAVNHPPAAPIPAASGRPLDGGDVTLRWLPAVDPDAELPSYELRIDADAEVLESWQQQIFLGTGVTSTLITAPLVPGETYRFAVRARDPHGALSSWSSLEGFTVTTNPPVTVGGMPATSLGAALGSAEPGDLIVLGSGTYTLSETLRVQGGVSIRGAGAGRTILDATGLGVGLSFDGNAPGHAVVLDGAAVEGADTCVEVVAGTTGVRLSHLVVRDCKTDGVVIRAAGGADLVNVTLVGNGTAIQAVGATTIKNSLLSANGVALRSETLGALVSAYNDLFDNRTDYLGLGAGVGDLSLAVSFADLSGRDLRLLAPQPSTDKGDPADPAGTEPTPNGGRLNLGAFGGTAEAETSDISTAAGGREPAPTPTVTSSAAGEEGGCAIGGPSVEAGSATIFLLFVLVSTTIRRRRARGIVPREDSIVG